MWKCKCAALGVLMATTLACGDADKNDPTEPPPEEDVGISGHWFGTLAQSSDSTDVSLEFILEQKGDSVTGTVMIGPRGSAPVWRSFWRGDSVELVVPTIVEDSHVFVGLPDADTLRGVHSMRLFFPPHNGPRNSWFAIRK